MGSITSAWLAFLAIAALLTLVIIRIISYHPVDRLFAVPIGKLNLNWVLEFAGLAMFYVGLVLVRRGPPFLADLNSAALPHSKNGDG